MQLLRNLTDALPGGKLMRLIWPFVAIVVLLVVLMWESFTILSAGRAFVEGESLWSKAQKESLVHLMRYAHTHQESDYRAFWAALAVPLGDRKARLELEKKNPDYQVAYQGFLEGRNHPDDIPGMIMLFTRFRHVSYIDRSITLWANGDRSIEEFIKVAEELHQQIEAGERDPAKLHAVVDKIFAVDAQLTPQEDMFSASLGEATRATKVVLSAAIVALAGILIPVGILLSRRVLQRSEAFQEALKSSEQRFQLVAQGTLDGIWDWNKTTGHCDYSPRYRELLGCTEEDFAPDWSSFESRLHPDDRIRTAAALQTHFENRSAYDVEYRLLHRSGDYRWFHARGQASWDCQGRANRFTGALRDITERKESELAVKRAWRFLDGVMNAIPLPLFVKDAQHRWVHVNDAFCVMLGRERTELEGRTDFDLFPEEQARLSWQEDDAVLASDHTFIFERQVTLPTGMQPWYLKSKKRVVAADNEVHIVAINADITALKHAEHALHQSELRFRSLVEMSSDWYWEQNEQLRFTFLSQETEAMSGKAIQTTLGLTRWANPGVDLLSADWDAHIKDCETHKPFRSFEYKRIGDDGLPRWLSINGEPIFDDAGHFQGYRGTGQDITERVLAQEELRRHRDNLQQLVDERTHEVIAAKELAETANRSKSEFLANMSHELRTPMHAILSYARLGVEKLAEGEMPRARMQQYFQRIDQGGQRLLSLLNDLLDLSKLEAGKMEYESRRTDLRAIGKGVISQFEAMANSNSVRLRLECSESSMFAYCDEDRIIQVLCNLLSNAFKFSPQSSVVTLSMQSAGMEMECGKIPAVLISVTDQGVGIPETELSSVFGKFIQSSRTKNSSGGTGLGLAICKQIVADHHGRIWAENNPQGGASIRFLLPQEPAEDTPCFEFTPQTAVNS